MPSGRDQSWAARKTRSYPLDSRRHLRPVAALQVQDFRRVRQYGRDGLRILGSERVPGQRHHRAAEAAAGQAGTEDGRVLFEGVHETVERRRAVFKEMLRTPV